ncbi:MAG: extracellular solute-binding protein [Oscillospiraceae bacterium]|nr:extracellular solute-binding protein [Oscillospiraceae bacterium]
MQKRLIAMTLMLAMMLAIFAACGQKDGNGNDGDGNASASPGANADAEGFVYVPTFSNVNITGENVFNQTLKYIDGKIYYFQGVEVESAPDADAVPDEETAPADESESGEELFPIPLTTEIQMFSMNIDGSDAKRIEGYQAPVTPEGYDDAPNKNYYVGMFSPNGDGTAWINESGSFGSYSEDYTKFDGVQISQIRKIKLTGEELLNLDLVPVIGEDAMFNPQYIVADKDGNVVIYGSTNSNNYNDWKQGVYVFSSDGTFLFTKDIDQNNGYINGMFKLPDGRVALIMFGNMSPGAQLIPIDITAKDLGSSLGNLPQNIYNGIDGVTEDGKYLAHDDTRLMSFEIGETETTELVNWINSDVDGSRIQTVNVLGDDILLTTYNYDYGNGAEPKFTMEIITLKKTPASEVKQKTVLTLACYYLDYNLRPLILNFNKTDPDYRINVKEYLQYNTDTDYTAGQTKLNTEIISGDVPDILFLDTGLPVTTYENKGVLEDLYPYLDADAELGGRNVMVQAVRQALETSDGKLFRIASGFQLATAIGRADIVGAETGWNMDDVTAAMAKAKPGAVVFSNYNGTRDGFMQQIYAFVVQDYVDWSTGEVKLNSPEFVKLIEYVKTLPTVYDWEHGENEMLAMRDGSALVLGDNSIQNFNDISKLKAIIGGELAFKGFPCESKNGNAIYALSPLGMSSKSEHKDGVWRFIRQILKDDYWNSDRGMNLEWAFPSNQKLLDERAEIAMRENHEGDSIQEINYMAGGSGWSSSGSGNDYLPGQADNSDKPISPKGRVTFEGAGIDPIEYFALSKADYDKFIAFLNSINRTASFDEQIQKIIADELTPVFSGQKDAKSACDVIQSRVDIYVNEQR